MECGRRLEANPRRGPSRFRPPLTTSVECVSTTKGFVRDKLKFTCLEELELAVQIISLKPVAGGWRYPLLNPPPCVKGRPRVYLYLG